MKRTTIEEMALNFALLAVELAAVVEWCVEWDGECLGDNPKMLAIAKRALAKKCVLLPPDNLSS